MARTECPECDGGINLDEPKKGAMVSCGECGTGLEIISTDPFEVDYPIDEDDYADDEEDDDEDD